MEMKEVVSLFIIEDNSLFATALNQYLLDEFEKRNQRISIQTFKTGESCLNWLKLFNNISPDIVIVDYYLNSQYDESMNGLDVMMRLRVNKPNAEVIFISAQNQVDVAVEALRMGAFDYIVKNKNTFTKILDSILNCLKEREIRGISNRN
jgi:DNA-binding NtrC family response regulator